MTSQLKEIHYKDLLDKELDTSVKPRSNPHTAQPEELIRDLHRMLTGNGDVTHGMLYKLAANTASVKLLMVVMDQMSGDIDEQKKLCVNTRLKFAKEYGTAEGMVWRKILSWAGKQKTFILVVLLMLAQLFKSKLTSEEIQQAAKEAISSEISAIINTVTNDTGNK